MSWLKRFSKKALSAFLAIAVVLCSIMATLSVFASTEPAPYSVAYGAPAIPMFEGKSINLENISVQFVREGENISGSDISWSVAGTTPASMLSGKVFSAKNAGKYELNASYNSQNKTIFVIVNEAGNYDFMLFDLDFSNASDFNESDWIISTAASSSFSDLKKTPSATPSKSFILPSEQTPYLSAYTNYYGMALYNAEILNHFEDYTIDANIRFNGNDYGDTDNRTYRGLVFKSNVDFNAADSAQNVFVGATPNGAYFSQRTNYPATFGAIGKTALGASNWGTSTSSLYTGNINGTENPANAKIENTGERHDVKLELSGTDIKYSLKNPSEEQYVKVFDSTEAINMISDVRSSPISASTLSKNDFADAQKTTAGNGIGLIFCTGTIELYSLSAKLNINENSTLPQMSEIVSDTYTINSAAPALPMYVGTKLDLNKVEVQIGDGYVSGSELTWEQDASSEGKILVDNDTKCLYVMGAGRYKISAKNASGKQNVWVLANEKGDTDFALAKIDNSGATVYDANNTDWIFAGAAADSKANLMKKDWAATLAASDWLRNVPSTNNQYFGIYDGSMIGMYFNTPILSDFTDYTVSVDMAQTDAIYNNSANFGIVVKANIDFNAELDSSIYVNDTRSGMYLAQRRYGTMSISSFDKPYYATDVWGAVAKPLFSITNEQAKTTLAGTAHNSAENQASTYSILHNSKNYRTVTLKMEGNELEYKLDGVTVFDSTAETVKGIDSIWNTESTFTTYNYEQDILPGVTTASGNSIGILVTNCSAEFKNIKAVLNETVVPDFAEDIYIVKNSSPAIPMFEGKQININDLSIEFSNGEAILASLLEWDGADADADAMLNQKYIRAFSARTEPYKFTVTNGTLKQNVYIIVNEAGNYAFKLEEENVRKSSGYDASEWLYGISTGDNNNEVNYIDKLPSASTIHAGMIPGTRGDGIGFNSWIDSDPNYKNKVVMYKSEILNDFSDYTLNMIIKNYGGNDDYWRQTFDIVLRSQVTTNGDGTMFAEGNKHLGLHMYPIGGIGIYSAAAGQSYVNNLTNTNTTLHTLSDSALIKAGTTDASYVLSASTKTGTQYAFDDANQNKEREVKIMLDGNRIVYTLDTHDIFDSNKQINSLSSTSISSVGASLSDSIAYTEGTVENSAYEQFMNGQQLADRKGSFGIMWQRMFLYLMEFNVTLNFKEGDAMPKMEDITVFKITNASPAIAAFAGTKVDLRDAMVQLTENGKFYMANELDWSIDASNKNNAGIAVANDGSYIAPLGKGIYTLKAETKDKTESSKIFVVSNLKGNYEFLIENIDFSDPNNTAIRDTANWYAGEGSSNSITRVENLFSLAGTDGNFGTESLDLWQSYSMSNHFYVYDSEILKSFADYTVTMDLNTDSNVGWPKAETGIKATNGIVARATVSGNTTNVFASGSTAINVASKNYGGVMIKSIGNTGKNFSGEQYTTLHTVEDVSLIKYETTNPSYILSHHIAANQKRRILSLKLEGNNMEYSVDGNITFDSSKDIKTLSATLIEYDVYAEDTASYTEGTYSNYASDMEAAALGKGTVGFSIVRSTASVYSIKVKLNNTATDADLLPYEDYNYAVIPANSGFYTSYLPKVSSSGWTVDTENSTAKYYVNDGGYITVINDGNALGSLVFNGTDVSTGKAISYEVAVQASTADTAAPNGIGADIIADSRVIITEPENGYFAFTVPQSLNLIPGTVDLFVNEVNTAIESNLTTVKDTSLTYKAAITDISSVRFTAQFEESADKLMNSVYNYLIQYKEFKEGETVTDNGIRFQTAIPAIRAEKDQGDAYGENVVSVGAIIIPTAILGEDGLTKDTVIWNSLDKATGTIGIFGTKEDSKAKIVEFTGATKTYTYHTIFSAVLKGINEKAKQYDISCLTYVKYSDGTYAYSDVAASSFNAVKNTDTMLTATTYSDSLPGVFDNNNVVLTVPILSDIHVEAQDNLMLDRYPTAINNLTQLSQKKAIDLVCVAGDLTSARRGSPGNTQWWSEISQEGSSNYNAVLKTINEGCGGTATTMGDVSLMTPYYRSYERQKLLDVVLKSLGTNLDDANLASTLSTAPKFFYSLGNHDSSPEYLNADGVVDANGSIEGSNLEYIASFMGEGVDTFVDVENGTLNTYTDTTHAYQFVEQNKTADNTAGALYDYFYGDDLDKAALHSLGNRHMVVNGFNFLAVNPEESKNNFEWLDNKLKQLTAKDPTAPVFVIYHFRPTMAFKGEPVGDEIGAVLENYPQAIMFGGHWHSFISFDNTVMQSEKGYYSIDCGSGRYLYDEYATGTAESEIKNLASALLMEVDNKGNIRITRINAVTGDRVGNNIIIPAVNNDGTRDLLYTSNRENASVSPYFISNVASAELSGDKVNITVPKTISPNTVSRFEVVVTDAKSGRKSNVKQIIAPYYKNNTWNYSPESYTLSIDASSLGLEIIPGGIYTAEIVAVDNWENKSRTIQAKVDFN